MFKPSDLVLGKYTVLRMLYRTALSNVYQAVNVKANRIYLLKEYVGFYAKRMKNYQLLQQLDHSAIPKIEEVIQTSNGFLVIQEYFEGEDLLSILRRNGAQKEEDVIWWAKQLCEALSYLHSQQPPLVFGKVCPENIFLRSDGRIALIKFDSMHAERAFEEDDLILPLLGFSGYHAPEHYGFYSKIDSRADIYGLGVTMYHLLTGQDPSKPPYEIKPIREINPALSIGLERIIQKCTRQDPNERYQSAAELMHALNNGKMDRKVYINGLKRKLRIFCYSLLLTVVCSGVALWAYSSAESKKKENYDFMLSQASSIKDYYDVIVIDPTRKEAYLGSEKNEGLIKAA